MLVRLLVACAIVGSASPVAADQLSPVDLARKHERGYVTAVPLFAYSVDFGVGGGVRGYYYWNGTRDDPRFATTPYLHRMFLNVFASTGGLQFHWLDYDAPRVLDSPYRVRAQLVLARNTDTSYYGFDDADRVLHFPGAPGAFASYDDYSAAQRRIVGGLAYTKYDRFDGLRPALIVGIERTFAGRVRVLGGFGLSYTRIGDYTGTQVAAVDDTGRATTAPMAPTRLREDCDAGELVGCAGGRDNYLRLAVIYDTRDFEPDPNCGVFIDLAIDAGTIALGSEYDYLRGLLTARGFWSPFREHADLVLAGRVLLQAQSAGTPFFTMSSLSFTEDQRFGLGGHRTMRGFRQDRFVDHVMSAANAELRWTFGRATVWRQKLAFIVVPFADIGRAFDGLDDLSVRDWRPSFGAAFRASWNLATLGTFEYGVSGEGTGFYVNFGHMF